MEIRVLTEQDIPQVVELWNHVATRYDYQALTVEGFKSKFIEHPYYQEQAVIVACESNQVIGFAAGCSGDDLPLGNVTGYLTCAWTTDDAEAALLHQLVSTLEQHFLTLGKQQVDILFFNPVKLIWNIPIAPQHEHNNAPGISKDMPLYQILIERGYIDRATQCAMYLPLDQYEIPDRILLKQMQALEKGYEIKIYDENDHKHLDQLLTALDNPQWIKEITQAAQMKTPFVVAIKNNSCVGFAGPIVRQPNGRALFSGIGVHPEHEGHGLGSILFYRMVEGFKLAGCTYVSLFTGLTNPALGIYEKAGFTTVKQFSILRKEQL